MTYCTRCGTQANDGERFCKNCGAELLNTENVTNEYNCQNPTAKQDRKINGKMLALSIVNITFSEKILGLIALINTINASKEDTDEGEARKLKKVKIINIIDLVIGIILMLSTIAGYVLMVVFGISFIDFMLNF